MQHLSKLYCDQDMDIIFLYRPADYTDAWTKVESNYDWRNLYLVRLSGFVKHARIDGSSHQVICSSDGMDITSEMKIKLKSPQKIQTLMHICVSILRILEPNWSASHSLIHFLYSWQLEFKSRTCSHFPESSVPNSGSPFSMLSLKQSADILQP